MDVISDLRDRLHKREIVIIAGAGVAAAASKGDPLSTWRGLLENGIGVCHEWVLTLPAGWRDVARSLLELRDVTSRLAVAEMVSQHLGGQEGASTIGG